MSPQEVETATAIIRMVLKYGVTAAVNVIRSWDIDRPTLDDIEALVITKKPEDYFTEGSVDG